MVVEHNNNCKAHVLGLKRGCGDRKVVGVKVGDCGESKMFVATVI